MNEREITKMFEDASIMSNLHPIEAGEMLQKALEAENDYCIEHELDEGLMSHSFYLDVVPIIEHRASAALAALNR